MFQVVLRAFTEKLESKSFPFPFPLSSPALFSEKKKKTENPLLASILPHLPVPTLSFLNTQRCCAEALPVFSLSAPGYPQHTKACPPLLGAPADSHQLWARLHLQTAAESWLLHLNPVFLSNLSHSSHQVRSACAFTKELS